MACTAKYMHEVYAKASTPCAFLIHQKLRVGLHQLAALIIRFLPFGGRAILRSSAAQRAAATGVLE